MSKRDKFYFLTFLMSDDRIKINFKLGKVYSNHNHKFSDRYELLLGQANHDGYIEHRFSSKVYGTKTGKLQRVRIKESFIVFWGFQILNNLDATLKNLSQINMEIDHINRIRIDDRYCNLRLVTRGENTANRSCSKGNK